MRISNAEKQARFRKKQELNKLVERRFREWQVLGSFKSRAKPDDVRAQFLAAAELAGGWTDEDYDRAVERVENLRIDLIGMGDELGTDVHAARSANDALFRAPDPKKWIAENEQAILDAAKVASHLVSALEISRLTTEEKAAALMEAVRHVGRLLANSPETVKTDAAAVCLAAANPHYDRPDWFIDTFARWQFYRLGKELTTPLAKRLLDIPSEEDQT